MQVISVERWTFWTAVLIAAVGIPLSSNFGFFVQSCGFGCATSVNLGIGLSFVVFILLLVSVAIGGSRDPSVRRLPARART